MLECDGPSLQKDYDSWQHEAAILCIVELVAGVGER